MVGAHVLTELLAGFEKNDDTNGGTNTLIEKRYEKIDHTVSVRMAPKFAKSVPKIDTCPPQR